MEFDQGIDILCEKDGIRYVIQCKHCIRSIGNDAIREAFADVAAVLTTSTFSPATIECQLLLECYCGGEETLTNMVDGTWKC